MRIFNHKCEYCGEIYDALLGECPKCGVKRKEEDINRTKNIAVIPYIKQIIVALLGSAGFMIISTIVSTIIGIVMNIDSTSTKEQIIVVSATINFISYGVLFFALLGTINVHIPRLLNSFKKLLPYAAGLIGMISLIAFEIIYSIILTTVGYKTSGNSNQIGLDSIIPIFPVLSVLIFGIVGPLCEELTYRVGLFSFFKRINNWLPYVITILVFALIHFGWEDLFNFSNPNYGAVMINELINLPPYFFAGFVFSFLYDKYGLAASTTAHVLNNLYSILVTIISINTGA